MRRIKLTEWDLRPHRERFEQTIKRVENGCWLWTGPMVDGEKSPKMNITLAGARRSTLVLAHRLALYYYTGVLPPEDADVVRACRHSRCVNPAHLEVRDDR